MYKILPATWIIAGVLFPVYLYLTPEHGHTYDMACWSEWMGIIADKGLANCYTGAINYLPGHLYEFKFLSLFFPSKESLMAHTFVLKYLTLIFDFSGALLLASLSQKKIIQTGLLLSVILNISALHNTMLWGQFDAVFSFFAFASILAAVRNRIRVAAILFVISLNFKFQAILFLPLLFLVCFYQAMFRWNWKKFLWGSIVVLSLQALILLPWILAGTTKGVLDVLKSLSGTYTFISLNAGNVWQLMLPGDLRWTGDENSGFGLTFKLWGLIMAMSALGLTLFPLLRAIILKWKKKAVPVPMEAIFAMGSLSVMSFFYFNTQMHERYTFPAFLFIAAYCYFTRRWWIYALFSIAYFLNNEKALDFFHLNIKSSWFDFSFASKIYLLVMLMLIVPLLFQNKKNRPETL
ncbi:MAG TPA: hypothetical protein PLU53_06955 [Bacteroidia bacterium]|nr:hypothetical protein [Bacteroidia bacterium]